MTSPPPLPVAGAAGSAGLEIAADDGRGEAALAALAAAGAGQRDRGLLRQSHHFERPGAVGRRWMKPRSCKPLISRWIPDLERSPKASFISSNEGEMPLSARRWLMKERSSYCLRVSMLGQVPDLRGQENKTATWESVLVWFFPDVKR